MTAPLRAPAGPSGAAPAGDLLVGRADELEVVLQLTRAPGSALVTLAGLAGVGKTRLAKEVLRITTSLGGAGLFVPLGGIRDAQVIGDRVIEATRPVLASTPAEALGERFGGQALTLVLDDLDQVGDPSPVLHDLLEGYPGLHLLATGARPLGLAGEVVVRLRPFAVPEETGPAVDLLQNPAVALFVQCARMVDATFRLTEDAVAGVAATCRAVGGLPLAIELAAARSATIPPAVMAQQLMQPNGLGLLADSGRDPGDRHASIGTTLEWAYGQLPLRARHDLAQLSIFEGSFDLEAALDVLAPRDEHTAETLDRLSPLLDGHVVDLSPVDPEAPRFSVAAIVRSFARARLAESGELPAVQRRHRMHFQARCQSGRPLLAEEIGDVLAALDRAIIDGGGDDGLHTVVEAAVALSAFPATARALGSRLEDLVARAAGQADDADVARALTLAATYGDADPETLPYGAWLAERVDAAVTLARRSGDRHVLLEALQLRVRAMPMTMDLAGGIAATREGLELARGATDDRALARFELYSAMAAQSVGDQATAAEMAGRAWARACGTDDAGTALQAALELHRLPGHLRDQAPPIPDLEELLERCEQAREPLAGFFVLGALASRDTAAGLPDAAARWIHRGLLVSQGWQRTRPLAPIGLVALLVSVALLRGDLERAVRLRTGIAGYDDAFAAMPHVVSGYQAACEQLAAQVPPQQYEAWAARARGLTPAQAARAALDYVHEVLAAAADEALAQELTPRPLAPGLVPMTAREREVLAQLATGGSNKEIARVLGMSPKTVMHHSMAIYRKLGVRGRGEAAAWAYRNGHATEDAPPT